MSSASVGAGSSNVQPPTLERERALGRWGAASAFLSVIVLCAALVVANAAAGAQVRDPQKQNDKMDRLNELVNFHNSPGDQALAAGLRCAGLVVGIGIAMYLFWLVRGRGAPASRWLRYVCIVGPLLVLAATMFGFFSLQDVSDAFFASGPRNADRASKLIDDSGSLQLAGIFDIGSRVVFAIGIGVLSLYAMRLELLTKFLGYWGIGAAVALVIAPVGDAMYVGWLASMGFLAAGWWPGGRPEAWDIPPGPASAPEPATS